jgi:hypothetical protein
MPNLILGTENEYCYLLANFLRDSLNLKYQAMVDKNPSLPKRVVVRGIRNYDDPSVTITEFPLLKVFRNQDVFDGVTPYRTTSATITYSTSYSDLEELPDLLYWVGFVLQQSFSEFKYTANDAFDLRNRQSFTVQYLLTQVGNTIYPSLRANITFKDTKVINC